MQMIMRISIDTCWMFLDDEFTLNTCEHPYDDSVTTAVGQDEMLVEEQADEYYIMARININSGTHRVLCEYPVALLVSIATDTSQIVLIKSRGVRLM